MGASILRTTVENSWREVFAVSEVFVEQYDMYYLTTTDTSSREGGMSEVMHIILLHEHL